jgi:hypothetical protein
VESLAASALVMLGWVSAVLEDYGAFEVQGRGVELTGRPSFPVTGGLLLVAWVLMYRVYRGEKAGLRAFPWYAAALILAFMLGLKFRSPQYVIWPLPFVPLGAGGVSGLSRWTVFLAACSLTAQVFPVRYDDLLGLRSPSAELLLARNPLLLWSLLLFLPGHAPEQRAA